MHCYWVMLVISDEVFPWKKAIADRGLLVQDVWNSEHLFKNQAQGLESLTIETREHTHPLHEAQTTTPVLIITHPSGGFCHNLG